jgi:hypothetical protein
LRHKRVISRRGVLVSGMIGIPALIAACRRAREQGIFSADSLPTGPRDLAILTVLSESAVQPVPGASLDFGGLRQMADGSGRIPGFSENPQEPIVFAAPGCYSYGAPTRDHDRIFLRTTAVSDPLFVAALHAHEHIRLPGVKKGSSVRPTDTVNLLYQPQMWEDAASHATADWLTERFTRLGRLSPQPLTFVAGTEPVPGALNVRIIEDPSQLTSDEGGKAEWWTDPWSYLIKDAVIWLRHWWYTQFRVFMAHEIGHGALGLRHPAGFGGFMDPATMNDLSDIDLPSAVVIVVSVTREAGTAFYTDVEMDPSAVGLAAQGREPIKPALKQSIWCPVPPFPRA